MTKTMIHKKSKTVSDKLIDNANVKAFSGNDVIALLQKLAVQPTVSGVIAKAPTELPTVTPSAKTKAAKPKQLVIKLYNSKTNAHEEMSLAAEEYCDLKLFEVINAIREEGFAADAWSFKIRIPVGL